MLSLKSLTIDILKGSTNIIKIKYLLDLFPNASVGYSLRQIRAGHTTGVIRVRRSSDNAELDFKANEITDGTLTTWTSSGDCFVTKWYDQSGSGNDAIQTTASLQPMIVDAGVLVTENGKPALDFNNSNQYFLTQSYIVELSQNDAQVIAVNKPKGVNGSYFVTEADSINNYSSNFIFGSNTGSDALWVNSVEFGLAQVNEQQVYGFQKTGGAGIGSRTFQVYKNGATDGASGNAQVNPEVLDVTAIGSRPDGLNSFFMGKAQEIITYKNTTNNIIDIQENINNHYSIY